MEINPKTSEAYDLMHQGILALAKAERQGFRIDVEYLENKKSHLTRKISRLESQFENSTFYKKWQRQSTTKINPGSGDQLGKYLYTTLGLKPQKLTKTGKGSTDEEALGLLNLPELNAILEVKKLKKIRDTYLDGFLREQINGQIHPFYNLNTTVTYRSCIAKGTKILAVRDFYRYPNGVPIEKIKEGDFVYCFDDNLNPAIQKVLWSGKTGHKEVIRIHYSAKGGGGKGFLDVTPEHLIRVINGEYVEAQNLVGDFRKPEESKRLGKIRTLSCKRVDVNLNFTGHVKGGKGVLEHRLVYSQLIGDLKPAEVVHHKDEDHFNHTPSNLRKMTLKRHSYLHSLKVSDEIKQNRIKTLKENRHLITYTSGAENPLSMNLTKFQCYRLLAQNSGKLKGINFDFGTIKKYLEINGIDPFKVRLRFDKHGEYIWKSNLEKISILGRSEVSKLLGHNHYRLLELYSIYGIDEKRKWGNQFGAFKPGNHQITKIEWVNKKVDVYDIEVEKYHNFFANEICVHNSSNNPNFQNLPARDEESMRMVKDAIFPRLGHQLLEVDFKGIEVAVNACINKDPVLIHDILHGDMHGDMAKQIFKVPNFDKNTPTHNTLRSAAKNGFVFPEFYGDYFKSCSENLATRWGKLPQTKWSMGQGIAFEKTFLSNHLISQGITSFSSFTKHIENIENEFWHERFMVYGKWKDTWFRKYQKNGFIDLPTGFRCSGVMNKKQVCNYPGQNGGFMCLLWSLIEVTDILEQEQRDTKVVGQIHDSLILDVHPDELSHILEVVKYVTCTALQKHFDWIILPMEVDASISGIDQSWATKEKCKI